jgi:hypothetical protein
MAMTPEQRLDQALQDVIRGERKNIFRDTMLDAIRAAIAEEREANCRAVCVGCGEGLPTRVIDDVLVHDYKNASGTEMCQAAAIRARS